MAIILILAMLLVDFIMTITAQRDLIRSEQARGDLLLSVVEARITPDLNTKKKRFDRP